MKYGPRGGNVHLAARIEAATKSLHQTVLVSGDTAKRLSARFTTARVCKAALPGIEEPVDLHAVWPRETTVASANTLRDYARALSMFESGNLNAAAELFRTIDPTTTSLPVGLVANHIERQLAAKCRRSSDPSPALHRGVIPLYVK
jgi:hypothetical protein